jgi:thiamine biosynthesis lipoprotein
MPPWLRATPQERPMRGGEASDIQSTGATDWVHRAEARPHVVRLAAPAMGTRFEVVLAGGDEARLRSAGEAALGEVCRLSESLSAFGRGSMVSYINTHAAEGPVGVDRELFGLLMLCQEGWRRSEGAFDITVGPLMEAWGFRGQARGDVDEARERVGMDKVELDAMRGTVRFARNGMRLDLGGVAKGFALDIAGGVLREAGVECALMHGGTSSVVAIGSPPGEDGWRIRVGNHDVALRDRALSVSAPRGRMIETEAGPLGHVLDPRTGAPAMGAQLACAVCESGAWAEVWSTALLVLRHRPLSMPSSAEAIVDLGAGPINDMKPREVCA